jgi:SPP1 gp7 family putative phage head morphogenesis protein
MPLEVGPSQPKEALAYWRSKSPVSKAELEALSERAKDRAFAVAGLARRDQVAQIHGALTAALENGEPLSKFKKRISNIIEQKGWTGDRAWRVENIYRTNMQSAFMAGRYTQMKKASKTRPYWRYIAVKDRRTRPSHAALNGKVYPHDHDFWSMYYPPNGFRCRCSVQTLSQQQVDSRGIDVEDEIPRLVTPDPGFTGNVGKNWLADLSPSELDDGISLVDLVRVAVCKDGRGSFASGRNCKPSLKTLDKRHILPVSASDILPKGMKPVEYVEAFLGEFGLQNTNDNLVHTLPGNIPVVISKDLFIHKASGKWKVDKSGREQYVKLLARTIKNPYEVWMVPAKVSGRKYNVLRLIRLFATSGGEVGGFAVFNLIGGRVWKGATAFTPKTGKPGRMLEYLEKQRQGVLVFREQ